MNLNERIRAFITLGHFFEDLPKVEFKAIAKKANQENGWFTEESTALAFQGLQIMLNENKLQEWVSSYDPEPLEAKTVGVAMAGSIPLVGFHDFLSVLISGNRLKYKPSSKDSVLMDFIHQRLVEIEPRFTERISANDQLKGVDAIIATGSDNTSRYFEYYFRNVPHIIRKNRVSCAVIQGDEPSSEVELLGKDIFNYYGLGCRNVSSIFVPRDFDIPAFLDQLKPFDRVLDNHKYTNNYVYQKSLTMLNQEPFLDTGYLLVKENKNLVSPVATLHYSVYETLGALKQQITAQQDKIQVIVSAQGWYTGSVPFGTAQLPQISDYADGVDTMKFLVAINKPN